MNSVKVQFLLWLSKAMGAFCSRSGNDDKAIAQTNDDHFDNNNNKSNKDAQSSELATSPQKVENLQETAENRGGISAETSPDEFYDGIPRFADSFLLNSLSIRSSQKLSEVSSRVGRASTVGFGKAVEVLDTLGSSMTSLNGGSGFISGASTKGNEIGILAFEVANTVWKGFNLMQSLSDKNIKHLKEDLFLSKAVKDLVSKDVDELLKIVAADKREELKFFSDEVVRFGNRSRDPQWHNMDRYFEKIGKERNSQRQSNDSEAELIMQKLMTLVQFTAELYHELHALDRSEQDSLRKHLEEQKSGASQRGDRHAILGPGLRSQKKQVKHLKKKSLWSCSLEEIMEKLVDIVLFLDLEINNAFGTADHKPAILYGSNRQRLGPAGLALHYANIVLQIDTLVVKSSSMPENTRDELYQNLPPNIKLDLRSKLPYGHAAEHLAVEDIKDEIQKTLDWLVPVATNTAKAHHGFGWVGGWASISSEANLKTSQTNAMRIETFHHADKDKVEKYVLELLLWLQRLAIKSGAGIDVLGLRSTMKCSHPALAPPQETHRQPTIADPALLTISEENMLQLGSKKGLSKSWDFDRMEVRLRENNRLTKSWSLSSSRRSIDISFNRISPSKLPVIDFGVDKERALDVIDRVEVMR